MKGCAANMMSTPIYTVKVKGVSDEYDSEVHTIISNETTAVFYDLKPMQKYQVTVTVKQKKYSCDIGGYPITRFLTPSDHDHAGQDKTGMFSNNLAVSPNIKTRNPNLIYCCVYK